MSMDFSLHFHTYYYDVAFFRADALETFGSASIYFDCILVHEGLSEPELYGD